MRYCLTGVLPHWGEDNSLLIKERIVIASTSNSGLEIVSAIDFVYYNFCAAVENQGEFTYRCTSEKAHTTLGT